MNINNKRPIKFIYVNKMKEKNTQPTYFALAVASFLLAVVLLFNILSPMAVLVTKRTI